MRGSARFPCSTGSLRWKRRSARWRYRPPRMSRRKVTRQRHSRMRSRRWKRASGSAKVSTRRACRVPFCWLGSCRLRALAAEVGHGRSPLPMNLLARHGLTIEALGSDSPARRAALRDYLVELKRATSEAATMEGPLTLFRGVDLQRDLQAIGRAVSADDPLAALHAPAHGLGDVLKTWRAARKWRGMVHNESRP